MKKMTLSAAFTLLLCSVTYIYSPQALAKSQEVLVNKLSDRAYILKFSNSWTNIGLLETGKGVVLIDPAAGKENLETLSIFIDETFHYSSCYVLNTHNHPDHTSGNDYFVSKGCVLISDVDSFEDIKELNFNSHTSNDRVLFHKESNSIFVGDIYETRGRALPSFWSGGMTGLNSAVEGILALGDQKAVVIPGHGTPTSKKELESFKNNTSAWVLKVKELKANEISASEMSNDENIRSIIERFNVNGMDPFITESSLTGYIVKTLRTLE